jgi:hypothetical protein
VPERRINPPQGNQSHIAFTFDHLHCRLLADYLASFGDKIRRMAVCRLRAKNFSCIIWLILQPLLQL